MGFVYHAGHALAEAVGVISVYESGPVRLLVDQELDMRFAPTFVGELEDAVGEHAATGTVVGHLDAVDPDGVVPDLRFVQGDPLGTFAVEPATKNIVIADIARR